MIKDLFLRIFRKKKNKKGWTRKSYDCSKFPYFTYKVICRCYIVDDPYGIALPQKLEQFNRSSTNLLYCRYHTVSPNLTVTSAWSITGASDQSEARGLPSSVLVQLYKDRSFGPILSLIFTVTNKYTHLIIFAYFMDFEVLLNSRYTNVCPGVWLGDYFK
jgi:hypothetical protein